MRLKENKDAELVRSSVPIAGENDGYVDAQPEIEDCSNGFAPQPNTTADGSQKMIVPVVLSMTSYLFHITGCRCTPISIAVCAMGC